MASIGWGCLADCEGYGTLGDDIDDYKCLSSQDASQMNKLSTMQHASHGMIFARQSGVLWDLYEKKGLVMMQMRFDGVLGFPGGLVDKWETPLEGVNREMDEEIGLDITKYPFTEANFVASYLHEPKNLVLHFYMMEVTPEDFVSLEVNTLKAKEYGVETFGIVRVPLFTMGDGIRGFPAFLNNQFAGNARSELIDGLVSAKLFTEKEMTEAVAACRKYVESLNKKKSRQL